MQCSCCDEQRDPGSLAALLCHDDIKICRTCIGWLMQQAGGVDVTPTLPVSDMDAAEAFYRRAGFEVRRYDDGFAFVTLDDQSVFDLGADARATPVHNAAGCYMVPGPDWKGTTPAGVAKVIPSETQFAIAIFRTQLFGPDDIENVKKVQAEVRGTELENLRAAARLLAGEREDPSIEKKVVIEGAPSVVASADDN